MLVSGLVIAPAGETGFRVRHTVTFRSILEGLVSTSLLVGTENGVP